MADKTIGDLPAAAAIYDDDLFLLEQSGEAKNLRAALYKAYLQGFVDAASAASEEAAAALAGVKDAINNIPEGAATPIVNDLTTGGTSMALSAEMGKALKSEVDEVADDLEALTPKDIGAINQLAKYYGNSAQKNVDDVTDGLAVVLNSITLNSELYNIFGTFAYVMTGKYDETNRFQVAWNLAAISKMATRSCRNGTWSAWKEFATTDYAVNKAGDTMTGDLVVEKSSIRNIHSVNANADIAFLQYYDPVNRKAANISWNDTTLYYQPTHDMATWSKYNFLHTGNKPSGSYTGNGSATSRTIETGGIGSAIVLWSNAGMAIITPGGALCKTGTTVSAISAAEVSFSSGVLTIASTNNFVNGSSVYYAYQVL